MTDLIHSRPFQMGFGSLALAGAMALAPARAQAQETGNIQLTPRDPGDEQVTWHDQDGHEHITARRDKLEQVRQGPVSNADVTVTASVHEQGGVPITNASSDGVGSYSRLTLEPEVQLYFLKAQAAINMDASEVKLGNLDGGSWGHLETGSLREMNFEANLYNTIHNAIAPREFEIDNEMQAGVALKWRPHDTWLPGLSATFELKHDGPAGTIVSADTALYVDPKLLAEGTLLPGEAEVKLRLGWYGADTDVWPMVSLSGYIGVHAEVVEQSPQAPFHKLDDRVNSDFIGGAELTVGGKAPQRWTRSRGGEK